MERIVPPFLELALSSYWIVYHLTNCIIGIGNQLNDQVLNWSDGRLTVIGCVEHTGHRMGTPLLRLSPVSHLHSLLTHSLPVHIPSFSTNEILWMNICIRSIPLLPLNVYSID